MTLPVPNLDDRTFVDLVTQARERIMQSCPTWTDLSVHDPGMALVEAFAYLTEVMIYRLNRLPEKAYLSFLQMLGVTRHPPAAAWVEVTFARVGTGAAAIQIPAGTRVTAARGADAEPVVFVVTEPAVLAEGAAEVTIRAHHCVTVDGELLGHGTGQPGLRLQASRTPIVTTTEPLDVLLGVEVPPAERDTGAAREHGGKTFEIWQPVRSFAGAGPASKVYRIDRATGVVTFAPALDIRDGAAGLVPLAAAPGAQREIRLWYRVGGGPRGNVAADTLTDLQGQLAAIKVTNRRPARGGRELEPVDLAVARGPYEFFALNRAVTARDFEVLATSGSAAIARARAFTRAAVLSFARPGEVEVVLVPHVPDESRPAGRLPLPVLHEHQIEEARLRTQDDLAARRALGTTCVASWARYKTVAVKGTVVVGREEDLEAVQRRVHERLHKTISPLPTELNPTGWPFGEPLRASNVYRMLEAAEPGVRYVDRVSFVVEEVPDGRVRDVAADEFQPRTWYACSGEVLFRSTNGGEGWEPVGRFPGDEVQLVVPAPAPVRPGITARPGSLVVSTGRDGGGGRLYLSTDLGEAWTPVVEFESRVNDIAWIDRDAAGALMVATDSGLYEVSLLPGSVPLQTLVDSSDPDRGFYAVASFVSELGRPGVAVAAQAQYGSYLSMDGGGQGTFHPVGLANVDTRTLAVQYDGPATVLWAGVGEVDPKKPGAGCFRARLFESDVRWQALDAGWAGGTCRGLAFAGATAVAATQSGGVLLLDSAAAHPTWQAAQVNSGLPLRDRSRFEPVDAVAASGAGALFAGGARGVYRSDDGYRWAATANRETREPVTIPDTWLLCSGEHQIEVVRQDAARGN